MLPCSSRLNLFYMSIYFFCLRITPGTRFLPDKERSLLIPCSLYPSMLMLTIASIFSSAENNITSPLAEGEPQIQSNTASATAKKGYNVGIRPLSHMWGRSGPHEFFLFFF